jgi:Cu/Ag efflux pump CusA
MRSGTLAAIALMIFGEDLETLRGMAELVKKIAEGTPGAVDVAIEQQVDIPQMAIRADREMVARYGLTTGEVVDAVERAFAGEPVGAVLEGQRSIEMVVRLEDSARQDLEAISSTLVHTRTGGPVPLKMLARITRETGPNTISREGVQRKMLVQANVAGRDLANVVGDLRRRVVATEVSFPTGYHVVFGGQFESAEEATRIIALLTVVVVVGLLLLLVVAFGSVRNALLTILFRRYGRAPGQPLESSGRPSLGEESKDP